MVQSFEFAGHSSLEWDTCITGANVFQSALKSVGKVSIPGRNGDLHLINKRFENVSLVYPSYIARDFRNNIDGLRNFLGSIDGYARLTDTYHPDEFRMAAYTGPLLPQVQTHLRMAKLDIAFDCKPQRFLVSGETTINLQVSGTTITNPTRFNAKPLIRVYGRGTVTIGEYAFTITTAPGEYTDIDCDSMEAYYGAVSCNANIVLQNNSFPVLGPGGNGILWTGSVTRVDITPRWWKL